MARFSTIDDVVDWFVNGHNGPTHDPSELRDLLERMVSRPEPGAGGYRTDPPGLARCWNLIFDFNLLFLGSRYGWIDRDGRIYGCGYASHERLLHWYDLTASEVESAGWVRVGQHKTQFLFKLTPKQRRALERMGHVHDRDAERLLPRWSQSDSGPA